MGLQSVARVAGKNRGYCRFLYGSGVFTANVMLLVTIALVTAATTWNR